MILVDRFCSRLDSHWQLAPVNVYRTRHSLIRPFVSEKYLIPLTTKLDNSRVVNAQSLGFQLPATFPFMVASKRRALSLSRPIPQSQPAYLFVDDIVYQFCYNPQWHCG
jgi:hypothetical protein